MSHHMELHNARRVALKLLTKKGVDSQTANSFCDAAEHAFITNWDALGNIGLTREERLEMAHDQYLHRVRDMQAEAAAKARRLDLERAAEIAGAAAVGAAVGAGGAVLAAGTTGGVSLAGVGVSARVGAASAVAGVQLHHGIQDWMASRPPAPMNVGWMPAGVQPSGAISFPVRTPVIDFRPLPPM